MIIIRMANIYLLLAFSKVARLFNSSLLSQVPQKHPGCTLDISMCDVINVLCCISSSLDVNIYELIFPLVVENTGVESNFSVSANEMEIFIIVELAATIEANEVKI